MALNTAVKTRENRLRHMAARQGMTLHRSRLRDPRALGYGRYWLAPTRGRGPVIGAAGRGAGVGDLPGLTLDEVEDWLTCPISPGLKEDTLPKITEVERAGGKGRLPVHPEPRPGPGHREPAPAGLDLRRLRDRQARARPHGRPAR